MDKREINPKNKESGMAALLTVIMIAAAVLIMALSSSFLGLGELDIGYTGQKGSEAFSVADGCMNESLMRIKIDPNYGIAESPISLPVSGGSCIINITDLGSNQRDIIVKGTSGEFNKNLESVITVQNSLITINSWNEKNN